MRRERGSVLLLVPAGVMVLLVLATIAVDAAAAFLAQRELANAAAAAANDAVAQIDEAAFYRTAGAVTIDPDRAAAVADAATAARRVRGVSAGPPVVVVDGDRVTVSVAGRANRVLGRGEIDVSARATAVAIPRR